MDAMYLVMNGVPFDVAFSLSAALRLAMVVAVGTLKGGRFDWEGMAWEQH